MSASRPSALCILNRSAGAQGKATADEIAAMFADRGVSAIVWTAKTGAELGGLVRRAVAEKHPLVVAGGGDGTVNCIASALIDTPATLGVLPLGTLNHFAKDIKIPLRLEDAVNVIAAGHVRAIDVGEVNGRIFLNNSSLGLYPRIVRKREQLQETGYGKWIAFARALALVLGRYSQVHVRLAVDGASRTYSTPFVFIGNNRYQTNGWTIGARERLDEGRLWLYLAPHEGPLGLAARAVRLLLGGLDGEADAFATTACRIDSRRHAMDVALDGEVIAMKPPLDYRTRPGALRAMAPAESASQPLEASR